MALELNLRFPAQDKLIVRLGNDETETLDFTSPICGAFTACNPG